MDVKHCLLAVTATVKYANGTRTPLELELSLIEGDDVLDLIEREVLDYVNLIGSARDYRDFSVNRMSIKQIKGPTTCRGCLEDQPNQQAHAQFPGDCLYMGSPI